MKGLVKSIENLKKTETKKKIDYRINEFKALGRKSNNEIFKELCFCILTANYSAEGGIRMQKAVGDGFLTLPEKQLAKKLKKLGYRFPNIRAHYISEARKHKNSLKKILKSFCSNDLRCWLVDNIKGLGYKEASHFLRNIGYNNYAIIDFHIIDLLNANKLIQKPKTITKNKYHEIEEILGKIAEKTNLSLGKLDLYLWYLETSKILK